MNEQHRETDRTGPGTLHRERIVQAAIDLVDRDGLPALSMRRLGADLGVEAMALYRHVDGREDLLEAMVDELSSSVCLSSEMDLGPEGGWRTYLRELAHEVRALAAAHPRIFPLVTTRHPAAPWIRPPLRSLDVVEDFLTTLTRYGFTDEQAVAAYRSFSSFLVGQLLLEVAQRGASPQAVAPGLDRVDRVAPESEARDTLRAYPQVERLKGLLSQDRTNDEFDRALENQLDQLARPTGR